MSKNDNNNNPIQLTTLTNFLEGIKTERSAEITKPISKILLIDDNFSHNDLIIPKLVKNHITINDKEENKKNNIPIKTFSPTNSSKNNSFNCQSILTEGKDANIVNGFSNGNLVDNGSQTLNTSNNLYEHNSIIKTYKNTFNYLSARKYIFIRNSFFGKNLIPGNKQYSYSVKKLDKEKFNMNNMYDNLLKAKEDYSNYFLLNNVIIPKNYNKLSIDNLFRKKPNIKTEFDENPTDFPIKSLLSERLQIKGKTTSKPIIQNRNNNKLKQMNLKMIFNQKLNSEKNINNFLSTSIQNINQTKILSSLQKPKNNMINQKEKILKFPNNLKKISNVYNNNLYVSDKKHSFKYNEIKNNKKLIGTFIKKNYILAKIKRNKLDEFFNKSKTNLNNFSKMIVNDENHP